MQNYLKSRIPYCQLTVKFKVWHLQVITKNLKIKIFRTITLPVVLYGCKTWLLTLREERKLRVFENMVLRRIYGPRRDEVRGNGGDSITRS